MGVPKPKVKEKMFKSNWFFLQDILLILLFSHTVHGGWDNPPFEAPVEAGSEIELDLGGSTPTLNVNEHYGEDPSGDYYNLVEIRVTDSNDVVEIERNNMECLEHGIEAFKDPANSRWFLRTKTVFDYEDTVTNSFRCMTKVSSTIKGLLFEIRDINDHKPRFLPRDPSEPQPVPELTMNVPVPLITLEAEDEDEADKDNLKFSIINDEDEFFSINDKGELNLIKELDYRNRFNHLVEVKVEDDRPPFYNDTTRVSIEVQDIPNIPPQFTRPPIKTSIDEVNITGQEIEFDTVLARDGDYGLNWDIKYSIARDSLDFFKIERQADGSGMIKVKNSIDAEAQEIVDAGFLYTFDIVAEEECPAGYPSCPADPTFTTTTYEVSISIKDVNDEYPLLCKDEDSPKNECLDKDNYSFKIDEDHLGAVTLDKPIIVKDWDSTPKFNEFTAKIVGLPDITAAFSVSPVKGNSIQDFSIVVNNPDAIDCEGAGSTLCDVDTEFTILIEETDTTGGIRKTAEARVTAFVADINDNAPVFDLGGASEYVFIICENTPDGEVLFNMIHDPSQPAEACKDAQKGTQVLVKATDVDKNSEDFGQDSVRYSWVTSTRKPPVEVDDEKGTMKIDESAGTKFDYERATEETFFIEARDGLGLTNTASVRFEILDVNDDKVDLRFGNGVRGSIQENQTQIVIALEGIEASDVDVTAHVELDLEVVNPATKVLNSLNEYIYMPIEITGELEDRMKKWFKLEEIAGSTPKARKANVVLGDLTELPDREGYNYRDVDRVDLIITATDTNQESGTGKVSEKIIITIEDINDNPPECDDGSESCKEVESVNFWETVEWKNEEGDQEDERQREILKLFFRDPDVKTTFNFKLGPSNIAACATNPDICNDVLDLFELDGTTSGSVVLRRALGKLIDREDRSYFLYDAVDILYIRIITSDGVHELDSEIRVDVGDRNDNDPEFVRDYGSTDCFIREDVALESFEVVHIQATDKDHPDRYGKIGYIINDDTNGPTNGRDHFKIDPVTGIVSPKFENGQSKLEWSDIPEFKINILAVDDYKGDESSGGNRKGTYITVIVNDANNHPPKFETEDGTIKKMEEALVVANTEVGKVRLIDKDDSSIDNGKVSLIITDVTKVPYHPGDTPNTYFRVHNPPVHSGDSWEFEVRAATSLTGFWGNYTVKFGASDGPNSDPKQLFSNHSYVIEIVNSNLNSPVFVYPENDATLIKLSIEDSVPREQLTDVTDWTKMPFIHATDADKGSVGGEVEYFISSQDQACAELFDVAWGPPENDENRGMVVITKKLEATQANQYCNMTLTARDKGTSPKATTRPIYFQFFTTFNTPPAFLQPTISVEISENSTEPENATVLLEVAIDKDIVDENPLVKDDVVYYHLTGEYAKLFVSPPPEYGGAGKEQPIPILEPIEPLDREEKEKYEIPIYATNDPNEKPRQLEAKDVDETNTQWQVITVIVLDVKDTAPTFCGLTNVTGGFSTSSRINDTIASVKACDEDLDEIIKFEITSSIQVSQPGTCLSSSEKPFEIVVNSATHTADIKLRFEPNDACKGYFTFQLTATDKGNFKSTIECRMYMVTAANKQKIYFRNNLDFVNTNKANLTQVLTNAFNWTCNVDRVYPDNSRQSGNVVIAETHFIDMEKNLPVLAARVKEKYVTGNGVAGLRQELLKIDFELADDGFGGSGPKPEKDVEKIVIYVLIGGVTVLTITLLILASTCYFNNRGLSRRVRALNADAFGAEKSDSNRAGLDAAPNTNAFAVEGSNPIWAVDGDSQRFPDFDEQSIASGGSVLIGAEDEDYFQKSATNPAFQAHDVVANYENDENMYAEPYSIMDDDYGNPNPGHISTSDTPPAPFVAQTRRNPLMNIDEFGEGEDADSDFDVGEFGAPPNFEDSGERHINDNFTMF